MGSGGFVALCRASAFETVRSAAVLRSKHGAWKHCVRRHARNAPFQLTLLSLQAIGQCGSFNDENAVPTVHMAVHVVPLRPVNSISPQRVLIARQVVFLEVKRILCR